MKDKEFRNFCAIYIIVGIALLVTVAYRTSTKKDFTIMKCGVSFCDLWCFSHFIMYVLLGIFAPKYWYLSFIMSILWEYTEVYLESHNVYISSNVKNDIITNSLGLAIGVFISSKIMKK